MSIISPTHKFFLQQNSEIMASHKKVFQRFVQHTTKGAHREVYFTYFLQKRIYHGIRIQTFELKLTCLCVQTDYKFPSSPNKHNLSSYYNMIELSTKSQV